ncbi:MAG TPA: disulfide bond formation protein B [Acidimicrobiia bacterium]
MSDQALRLYNTFLALLALVSLAGAAALVTYRLAKGREAAGRLLGNGALWLAWAVAAVCTTGSLVYSEVVGFVPCLLCWVQRGFMYPLSLILLGGAIWKKPAVKYVALPMSLLGLATSVYHYVIQIFPHLEGISCNPTNPCSARYVEVFGFVSIPFMAGAGFTLISVLLLFYVKAKKE